MLTCFRPLLPSAAALVALVSAPPAAAEFKPGATQVISLGEGCRPDALVALQDQLLMVLVQEADQPGRLVTLACPVDGATWKVEDGWSVPKGIVDLAFDGEDLIVWRLEDGTFDYCLLDFDSASQRHIPRPGKQVLDLADRMEHGLVDAQPHSFAVARDGSLVLGFSRTVLQVAPQEKGKAEFKWILGQGASAPGGSEGDAKQNAGDPGAGSRGLIVAVDSQRRVLAIDQNNRAVYRVDPETREKSLFALSSAWGEGAGTFRPEEALAWGEDLFVAGRKGNGKRTLVVLEPTRAPGGSAGVCGEARDLDLELEEGSRFGLTPSGHLVITDPQRCEVRLISNTAAPADARVDGKDQPGPESSEGILDLGSIPEDDSDFEMQLPWRRNGPASSAHAEPTSQEPISREGAETLAVERKKQRKRLAKARKKAQEKPARSTAPVAAALPPGAAPAPAALPSEAAPAPTAPSRAARPAAAPKPRAVAARAVAPPGAARPAALPPPGSVSAPSKAPAPAAAPGKAAPAAAVSASTAAPAAAAPRVTSVWFAAGGASASGAAPLSWLLGAGAGVGRTVPPPAEQGPGMPAPEPDTWTMVDYSRRKPVPQGGVPGALQPQRRTRPAR